MRRREFVTLLGSAAASPLAAHAQQASMPVIGFLDSGARSGMTENLAGFHRGLAEFGYVEGKNVRIEYRWAQARYEQLPALAAELVRRPVAVIAATRSSAPARAAQAATSTIPIVFQTGSDPVKDRLVVSFNRPGGNVTGATRLTTDLISKTARGADRAGAQDEDGRLAGQSGRSTDRGTSASDAGTGASARVEAPVAKASTDAELDTAFATVIQAGADALIIGSDNLFIDRRKHIVALTIRHAIPTMFFERDSVVDGGLMTYSAESRGIRSARSEPTSGAFLTGRSPQICRCCSRPSSIWCLTSRPRRQSTSAYLTSCSHVPTR